MSTDNTYPADPVADDEPPYFPTPDPDAPAMPDWENVEPEGEQLPDTDDDNDDPADHAATAHPGEVF